jgi:phosphoribosyl 1,2-cyclic phosphodiesterase
MIDCGADWLRSLQTLSPTAIVLTHGHGDHAFGLAGGAPCPVFAAEETWALLDSFPLSERKLVKPRAPLRIGGVRFEAFPVQHSLRAPAVGYRVSADRATFFYVPDLAAILDQESALGDIDLYIGDGATVVRPMIRKRDQVLIGHASIAAQLRWCSEEGVKRAIFTHCGSEIVGGDGRKIAARVRRLGAEHDIRASIAHDGMTLNLPV